MKNKINSLFEKVRKAIFTLFKTITYSNLQDRNFKMHRYIDIVVHNKLSALKKIPIYIPKAYLFAIYGTLQTQYIEISKDSKIKAKIKRKEHLETLKAKYNILVTCGTVLSILPDNKDVLDFLQRSGISGVDMLKRIKAELKSLQSKIENLQEMEKKDMADEKKSEPLSEAYYVRIFALLNKHGYKAGMDMSVVDFIETMNIYKQEIEENNKQIEKLKNRK